ncbi:MAG: hypothetical protein AAF571_05200 [Verrucomicrobiota bacterium]
MSVHKIAISPCTYIELGLKSISFASKEEAIESLENAFHNKSITYSIDEAKFGSIVYKDPQGGTLAEVFPMRIAIIE